MKRASLKLKKSLSEKCWRWCRLAYLKVLRMDDSPEKIAQSAALGAFIGIMPTLGVGIILCLIGSFIFRLNKASTILGSCIMNPITTPIFWSLSMTVGGLIFWQDTASVLAHGTNVAALSENFGSVSLIFVTGNTVIASIGAAMMYFFVKKMVIRHRARKAEKLLRKTGVNSAETERAA